MHKITRPIVFRDIEGEKIAELVSGTPLEFYRTADSIWRAYQKNRLGKGRHNDVRFYSYCRILRSRGLLPEYMRKRYIDISQRLSHDQHFLNDQVIDGLLKSLANLPD